MSANFDAIFYHKVQEFAQVLAGRGVPDWDDYKPSEALHAYVYDGGKRVDFRRSSNRYALCVIDIVTPEDLGGMHFGDPVVLKSDQIDATAQVIDNRKGTAPLTETYSAEFAATETSEDAISAGASLSISATFKEGGDASPVSAEQSITAEIHSEWSHTTGHESSVSRTVTHEVTVAPGDAIKVFATRSIDKVKRIITGFGDFTYSIKFGKHWSGHWQHPKHTAGTCSWDSLDEFLLVITGEGPDNYKLAGSFKSRPATEHQIDWIKAPLNAPYRQEMIYDDVTNTHVVETSLVSGESNVRRLAA